MTFQEFGLILRTEVFPELQHAAVSDLDIAQYYLNKYPKFYNAISPNARRIKEVSDRVPSSQRWTEAGRIESEGMIIANQSAEINMLHQADMLIKASSMGVPAEALVKISEMNHALHCQKELLTHQHILATKKDNAALDAANRDLLTPQELIALLERELDVAIDERDRETHPEKRADKTESIAHQREALRGRRQQAMVQITGGPRLDIHDEDPDGPRGGGAQAKESVDKEPHQTARVGF